ncbi:MAG: response regulator transcription factor [Verrucomicrobia subdivision 3 bacterium]|nr:response regulator transcription factor [Limisphaerales bacterium]
MKRILVIEDQPVMRRNIQTILEMEGFEVITAANGREGVVAARSALPDLILCDVMMPELDGYGVLAALRREPATAPIPFIFLTAKGEQADLRTGMNLGADDYLPKPVSSDGLLAAVNARLARQQAQDERLAKEVASASGFNPDFSSAQPLEQLGLTPREAEVLLWVAQGKSNGDIAILLGMAETTVKRHLSNLFPKLGVESRNAATMEALEILSRARPGDRRQPAVQKLTGSKDRR